MMEKRLQELCECAFKQGYGEMAKKSPGFYLPHISKQVYNKLLKINGENKKCQLN